MTRYIRCSECNGSGSTSFEAICVKCSGKKTFECGNCRDGDVQCNSCNGTGKEKILIFFSSSCATCQGRGSMVCPTCKGTSKIECPKCGGTGHISQQKKCTTCNGSGRIEDADFREWTNALQGFSVDRLKDERHRRERKINDSRSKIRHVEAELREAWDDWETDPASSNNCRHGWNPNEWGLNKEIPLLEGQISELEEEVDLIQEVLDKKWT